jgi:hypothetical protein
MGATVGLKTAAETVEQQKPGPKCSFGELLRKLEPDDYAYYQQMIREGKPKAFIADVFRADGHDVSQDKVRRHEGGRCSCR